MPTLVRGPHGETNGYFRRYEWGKTGPKKEEKRPPLPPGMTWGTLTNTAGEIYWIPVKSAVVEEQKRVEKKLQDDWDAGLEERRAAYQEAKARNFQPPPSGAPDMRPPVSAPGQPIQRAPLPQGPGQTSGDLRGQIAAYRDIPLVGSENAVFQAGAAVNVRVGPKLPHIPGVKPPNQKAIEQWGQRCSDEGEISLGRKSKDLLKWMGVALPASGNVCINIPQAVKKVTGQTADKMLDLVEDTGDNMRTATDTNLKKMGQ
jgi:hypothetical protein